MLWDSRHIHNINNMINATYITCVCSEKEALLGLLQLGVRFLADSNSWNGKLQNYEACSQLAYNSVLAQLSVLFSVGLEPNFKYQFFYFQVYGNFVELSIAQCIKSYRKFVEEVCRIKGFRAILERYGRHILCTSQKLHARTSVPKTDLKNNLREICWSKPSPPEKFSEFGT